MWRASILLPLWLGALCGAAGAAEILNGAGATFPSPFYHRLIAEYQKTGPVKIGYREVGSGEGLRLLAARKVDFGASDIFLSDEEHAEFPAPVYHIPTCVGAVAIIYNLPGSPYLKLDSRLLADVFMGRIASWSDGAIGASYGNTRGFDMDITVVHRIDSSGTTFILTDYLSKTSLRWKKQVGRGKRVGWHVGLAAEGNGGVAEMVSKIPGSIGYVSLNYAEEKGLPVAAVLNRAGRHVVPTGKSVSLAANVALPEDCRLLITDTLSEEGYPISAFTYILVYRNQAYGHRSREKAEALVDFLAWVVTAGQRYAAPLYYAPLPESVAGQALRMVRSIRYRQPAEEK